MGKIGRGVKYSLIIPDHNRVRIMAGIGRPYKDTICTCRSTVWIHAVKDPRTKTVLEINIGAINNDF